MHPLGEVQVVFSAQGKVREVARLVDGPGNARRPKLLASNAAKERRTVDVPVLDAVPWPASKCVSASRPRRQVPDLHTKSG